MFDRDEIRREYEVNGYAIIRNAIDPELLREVDRHVNWLVARYPELRPEHLHHPLIRDDAFWVRLVTDPRLLEIASSILGPDLACFTAHYICKTPEDGLPVLWHQDGAYWSLEPMEALTLWLAVDRTTTENGCLQIIPGSHRMPLESPESRDDDDNMLYSSVGSRSVQTWLARRGVAEILLNPGDVSIHHPHILHCSAANKSSGRRCGLDIGYIPTTTKITSTGVYMNPLLVSGSAVDGINQYRGFPRYDSEKTLPEFNGYKSWDDHARSVGILDDVVVGQDATPLEQSLHMIERLKRGTTKQVAGAAPR